MKKLIILALLVSDVKADQLQCIAEIMHAEAQGEPITGLIAIAEASVNRSKTQKRNVCAITGVARKSVPKALRTHYLAIANGVVKAKSNDHAKGADSWEARIPSYKGKITAKIGGHYFYKQEHR
jgi:spore germination cell wall hydrolase CwlJ-like protein